MIRSVICIGRFYFRSHDLLSPNRGYGKVLHPAAKWGGSKSAFGFWPLPLSY